MPKQKYFRGHKVKLPNGREGIIDISYSDLNSKISVDSHDYMIRLVPDGELIRWIAEDSLSQTSWDRDAGEKMLQEWKDLEHEEGG